ncbi:hypothetical protein J21TS7_28580 [Paenibacillus cineris]|uniref:Uncharacterized protein n=1 Tax=Paenibacillus cineris TaxID=237530 RepID=A0ABQ4LE48_9BACL|nr:hypothetical protein J21TS7_28580 [Paenibacillus cineris]
MERVEYVTEKNDQAEAYGQSRDRTFTDVVIRVINVTTFTGEWSSE